MPGLGLSLEASGEVYTVAHNVIAVWGYVSNGYRPRCSCLPARSMLVHRPGEAA